MPNINELRTFLKADMVQTGDIIHFCDAGIIEEREYKNKPGKKQLVLEMEVSLNEDLKRLKYTPNAMTRDLLGKAWGEDTENWVGKVGVISVLEQVAFGELINVVIVKPYVTPQRSRPPQAGNAVSAKPGIGNIPGAAAGSQSSMEDLEAWEP